MRVVGFRSCVRRCAAVVLMAVVLTGCSDEETRTVCVALFDVSTSVAPEVRERYVDEFDQYAEECARRQAAMTADLIGSDALSEDFPPLRADFRLSDPTGNTLYDGAERDRIRTEFTSDVRALVEDLSVVTDGTDIFGALLVAARKFQGSPDDGRLTIWSDGLQSADPFNISHWDLTKHSQVDSLLADLREAGLMDADLTGVHVAFAGVNVTQETQVTRGHLLALESFWRRYIEELGGVVTGYDEAWSPGSNTSP